MISIEELVTPVTADEQLEKFLVALEVLGLKPRAWRPAGALRSILRIVAAFYAAFAVLIAAYTRMGFLELAEGVWLTLHAFFVFGVERPPATFASGDVTITNTGGLDLSFVPGQLRVINTAQAKAYTNIDSFALHPLSVVTVTVRAVEIGSASSAVVGAIDALETQYAGVTVTNAAPLLGLDEMGDPDLVQLCQDKRAGRSVGGPRGAYGFAIRNAKRDDGTRVNVNRMSISPSSSTGVVTIVVASPTGAPTSDDVDAVKASIEASTRPDTVTVLTTGAVNHPISRTLTVWAKKRDGLTEANLRTLVLGQLLALNASHPIGGDRKDSTQGYLFASTLDGVAKSGHESIFAVDGIGSDETLAANEVVTLSVTVSARIVDSEVHA